MSYQILSSDNLSSIKSGVNEKPKRRAYLFGYNNLSVTSFK